MSPFALTLFTGFLLLSMFLLTLFTAACRKVQQRDRRQPFLPEKSFVFPRLRKMLFGSCEVEGVLFCIICTLNLTRFVYALFAVVWLLAFSLPPFTAFLGSSLLWLSSAGLLLLLFALAFVLGDYLPRCFAMQYPDISLRFSTFAVSLLALLSIPVCYPLYWLCRLTVRKSAFDLFNSPTAQVKQEIIELIHTLDVPQKLEPHDRALIESVIQFRSQLAKEVMVPRVDVFSLPGKTPIREAARLLEEEGYSRIPVYGSTIDDILGLLMYKDVIHEYMEFEETGRKDILSASIHTLVKDVLFTPETKKISQLLQEFRQRQVHMAIVVDEYGGTEGIITIEDILEQIVGEIADEYDYEEEMFSVKAEGGWVVDAHMSILDVEDKLGVAVPQDGDYDTLAGFVFHCTGSISPKGFVIHRDHFDLEVLASNDRRVEKVWLRPTHAGGEKRV